MIGMGSIKGVLNWLWILFLIGQVISAQESRQVRPEVIRIGLLIEDDGFAAAREGAELAVRQINEQGILKGHKLELLTKSMHGPWGKGSKQAVDLIFDDGVWALIGSSQGRNAHLVEQVIAKTNVVFLSAWAADPTLSKAYVPHFFNCVPNSEQRAESIVEHMESGGTLDRWILVSDKTYDSEQSKSVLLGQDRAKRKPPSAHVLCESPRDFDRVIEEVSGDGADAVVVLCEREVAVGLVDRLRSSGLELPVYLDLSGAEDRENLLSSYAFDAVRVIAEAVERSGYEQSGLRDAMTRTDHQGKTGTIRFDERGNRQGIPSLIETSPEIFSFGKR